MDPSPQDIALLRREKYNDDSAVDLTEDIERLRAGEPLAYVIGHIPFYGLSLSLDSRPLIPRPETEWWTEKVVERIGEAPLRALDLCAGSGAIGLALLKHCPQVHVSFGELRKEHTELIKTNLERNNLDATRATIHFGDLFAPFAGERFDLIVTNPPYIPEARELEQSVKDYEPSEALFAGADGLQVISQIAKEASAHLHPSGELWMECDIANIEKAKALLTDGGAQEVSLFNDQYERPRVLVAYY